MKIKVNGKEKEIPENYTVEDLVKELGITTPLFVVERNFKIVLKEDYAMTLIKENDNFEVVGFFGGG